MEEDIQNYLPTVMFHVTPCMNFNNWSNFLQNEVVAIILVIK